VAFISKIQVYFNASNFGGVNWQISADWYKTGTTFGSGGETRKGEKIEVNL
jgi:hypothetical protein